MHDGVECLCVLSSVCALAPHTHRPDDDNRPLASFFLDVCYCVAGLPPSQSPPSHSHSYNNHGTRTEKRLLL